MSDQVVSPQTEATTGNVEPNKAGPDVFDEAEYNADPEKFNPYRLLISFKRCIVNADSKPADVNLKSYVLAYTEILKFMDNLGAIFYFVTVDVRDKLVLLESYIQQNPADYETIIKMVNYEKKNNLHETLKLNGSRTILRLHRALLFIYKFLERLVNSTEGVKSSTLCVEVYEATLGKHHTWIARKAATLGMLTLPRREVLVEYMCRKPSDLERFPEFVNYVDTVYNLTESTYEKHGILDLP